VSAESHSDPDPPSQLETAREEPGMITIYDRDDITGQRWLAIDEEYVLEVGK
jgi:hypothetical protein